jgi:hypothetical protein
MFRKQIPARGVKFPQKGLKEKPAMIAGDSLAKLLKQLNEPHRTMVSLIAATGLRIGELLALRWSALDLEGGALTVRESVFEGKFQPPKTMFRTVARACVAAIRTGPAKSRTSTAAYEPWITTPGSWGASTSSSLRASSPPNPSGRLSDTVAPVTLNKQFCNR